jgi:hypothetical protein
MGENKERVFAIAQKTASARLTIESLVTAIISDPTTPPGDVASIKMAAADVILSAGTGLLTADCLLAVSPRHVLSRISDLISCESFEEHLQAIHLFQRYALKWGCRPPVSAPRVKIAWLCRFENRETICRTSLVNPLSHEALDAYVAWLRRRRVGTVSAK